MPDKKDSLIKSMPELPDHSPAIAIICTIGKEWTVRYVSSKVSELGYSDSDFYSGKLNLSKISEKDDFAKLEALVNEKISQGIQTFTLQYRLNCATGEYLWTRTWVSIIPSIGSTPSILHLFFYDISTLVFAQSYLDKVLKETSDLFLELDNKGCVLASNKRTEEVTGASRKDLFGLNWNQYFLPAHQKARADEYIRNLLQDESPNASAEYQTEIISKNSKRHRIQWHVSKHKNLLNNSVSLLAFGIDITDRDKIQTNSHLSEFPKLNPNPIIRINRDGDTEIANPAAQNFLEALSHDSKGIAAARQSWQKLIIKALKTKTASTEEISVGERHFLFSLIPSNDNKFVQLYGTDVSKLRESQELIEEMAYHDKLTGLSNRAMLDLKLNDALATKRRNNTKFAVLMLDLDHFKDVNDVYGHLTGDKILSHIGARLTHITRKTDCVARFGGDEFVILQTNIKNVGDTETLARKVISAVKEPIFIANQKFLIETSIGIVTSDQDEETPESILKKSDIALYEAKRKQRGSFRFHSNILNESTVSKFELAGRIAAALENGEFRLTYQPQINLTKKSIKSCEALLRWHPSDKKVILPEYFIPILEEYGYIHKVGEWVINEALHQLRIWLDKGVEMEKVAVNVSTLQLRNVLFADTIIRSLHSYNIEPSMLELEITESINLYDESSVHTNIKTLSEHGVELAIDDFGTGYSSLTNLNRLPLKRLKIDQSLILDLVLGKSNFEIISAIVAMSKNLNLETIAEGVETNETIPYLVSIGCTFVQGYYFGKPMYADEFEKYITKWVYPVS